MKKLLIGSLVGAVLVFMWQAAHMVMHHHDASYKNVTDDVAVLQSLSSNIKEEGQYFIPNMNLSATNQEQQKMAEAMKGKPWAIITYHPSYDDDMGMDILRSFVTDLLCVMILIGILGKAPGSFMQIFLKTLGAGLFAFLLVWYNYVIWMKTPWEVARAEMIDLLVSWGLCGLWLGWYLSRPAKNRKLYGTTV